MARRSNLAGPQVNSESWLAQAACDVLPVDWRNFYFFSYFYAYFKAFDAMLHAEPGGSAT